MKRVELAKPSIGFKEILEVIRVLLSKNLAQGKKVKQFESDFSALVEMRECVAVNSGTSALHLALLSLGIGPGDEVIVPSFTFAATANVVKLVGASPIFVDIDAETFNIDPKQIELSITKATKAIMVVHLYGLPANMTEISEIAKKHNLMLIEDAAQAHGAMIGNRPVGTWGDAAAFSFYPTKNITSGEGGMIVLKNSNAARTCRLLRNQGMETRYQNEIVGYNLRMTDIHAAIGVCQLKKLEKINRKRLENAQYLTREIRKHKTPSVPDGFKHVFHQYTLRITSDRKLFIEHLDRLGIGSSVYYPIPVHELPPFRSQAFLPQSVLAAEQVVSIPVHPNLNRRALKRVVKAIESFEIE
jgi:dTDP-4-amino-4,6-dideoxygalactose transaminase